MHSKFSVSFLVAFFIVYLSCKVQLSNFQNAPEISESSDKSESLDISLADQRGTLEDELGENYQDDDDNEEASTFDSDAASLFADEDLFNMEETKKPSPRRNPFKRINMEKAPAAIIRNKELRDELEVIFKEKFPDKELNFRYFFPNKWPIDVDPFKQAWSTEEMVKIRTLLPEMEFFALEEPITVKKQLGLDKIDFSQFAYDSTMTRQRSNEFLRQTFERDTGRKVKKVDWKYFDNCDLADKYKGIEIDSVYMAMPEFHKNPEIVYNIRFTKIPNEVPTRRKRKRTPKQENDIASMSNTTAASLEAAESLMKLNQLEQTVSPKQSKSVSPKQPKSTTPKQPKSTTPKQPKSTTPKQPKSSSPKQHLKTLSFENLSKFVETESLEIPKTDVNDLERPELVKVSPKQHIKVLSLENLSKFVETGSLELPKIDVNDLEKSEGVKVSPKQHIKILSLANLSKFVETESLEFLEAESDDSDTSEPDSKIQCRNDKH